MRISSFVSPRSQRPNVASFPSALLIAFLASLSPRHVTAAAVPIPAETENTISLNGTWRFKLEQAPAPPRFLGVSGKPIPIEYPAKFEAFYAEDYREDTNWHNLKVPGNWEMAGFSPATYDQPDNASGFYRLNFSVPSRWKGRIVKINFDGVQNGCEIWCNGKPVAADESSWGKTNYHEGGWTAWQADLTPVVKFGETNLLALRVTKNTKGVDCDTGDFFLLGGVHRPVTLFSVPSTHLQDISIRTTLLPNDRAEVTVIAQLNGAVAGEKVSVALEGQSKIKGDPDASGVVTLKQVVRHPKLWSAEWPNLYALSVAVVDSKGKQIEQITRKIGIREVTTKDGVFYVNGVPVKLVGICRHDVYPTLGTAINPEVWKKDLTMMKAANFNAVRTSHYPYGSGFYDLCDEMGFYVLDEEPFCWVNCDDPELMPAFEQRARETVRRDKNHPCVVIWGVGNENHPGRDNTRAARITREMDPTRPRLISCQKAGDGGANVEFDDAHYITPQHIHKDEKDKRRAKVPMIYTENPNIWEVRSGPDFGSLDLWGAVIQRTWSEIWKDEHVCGTFLWEWQDRAVADQCPTKYYNFFPETGINVIKIKGIVDGFRNPRPEYFHCKMAQSPIAITGKPEIASDSVTLQIKNHYSFTDLKQLRVNWSLLENSKTLASGKAQVSVAPRAKGTMRLSLPSKALANADSLRLEFNHPGGWNVVTHQVQLKPVTVPAPALKAVASLKFPEFNLVTGKKVSDSMGWKKLERQTAVLSDIKVVRGDAAAATVEPASLSSIPFNEIQSVEAAILLQPGSIPAGHLHADVADGKLSYQVTWSGEKSDIYELGWIFHAPSAVDHFSWSRQPFWDWYPTNHIGRPFGTATPDSAKVQLTKVDRPDAFDFNSTKFDCDWASLAGSDASGICVLFSPEQRQHVRAQADASGKCSLVVNRCYSPPRDISSSVVSDLYTVLTNNQQIAGSFRVNSK